MKLAKFNLKVKKDIKKMIKKSLNEFIHISHDCKLYKKEPKKKDKPSESKYIGEIIDISED
jgi:hypothetical protein